MFAYMNFRFRKYNKYIAFLFICLAVLIPSILAGVRSTEIGTDVNVYITPVLKEMKRNNANLLTLLKNELFVGETNGVLFTTILYFFSKFENGLFGTLFVIEILCLTPVIFVIQKQDYSALLKTLALFCYYCIFFHYNLNLMKQCVAVSISFWGFELIYKNKKLSYFVLIAGIILLIHKTAVLSFLVYFVYLLSYDKRQFFCKRYFKINLHLEKKSKRRFKIIIFLILIAGLLAIFVNIRFFLELLVGLKHSYVYQLANLGSFQLKYSNLVVMFLILAPVLMFQRKTILIENKYRFYFFICVLSAVLYQFVGMSPALYRLSLYTLVFVILAIPNFVKLFRKDKKIIAYCYYTLVVMANFVFDVIISSYANTFPYYTSYAN